MAWALRYHLAFGLITAGLTGTMLLATGVRPIEGMGEPVRTGIRVGALIAAALAVLGYTSLVFSLRRSNIIFLSVFFSGMLFRFFAVGLVAWIAFQATSLDLTATLLSLVGGYLLLSFPELLLLVRQVRPRPQPAKGTLQGQ